jgi:hypothetical protein
VCKRERRREGEREREGERVEERQKNKVGVMGERQIKKESPALSVCLADKRPTPRYVTLTQPKASYFFWMM